MKFYSDDRVDLYGGDSLAVHGQRIGCCAGCQHLFSSDTAFSAHRRVGQCRRYVGFERREEQCEAAARRLSQGVLDFGEGRL